MKKKKISKSLAGTNGLMREPAMAPLSLHPIP